MTVCQLYAKKNSQRKNVKRNTEKGLQYLMKILENDPLDNVNIKFTKNDRLKITNFDHIYSSRESRTSFVL